MIQGNSSFGPIVHEPPHQTIGRVWKPGEREPGTLKPKKKPKLEKKKLDDLLAEHGIVLPS